MELTYLFTTIVVASQATVHQPKSVAATVLLGSTSANYQKALGRFTDRLINCQFHKKSRFDSGFGSTIFCFTPKNSFILEYVHKVDNSKK